MHNTDQHIGLMLRQVRESRGETQEMLAAFMGITPQAISKIEKGLSGISAGKLWGIAKYFDVPIQDFFGEANIKPRSLYDMRRFHEFMEIPEEIQKALLRVYRAIVGEE